MEVRMMHEGMMGGMVIWGIAGLLLVVLLVVVEVTPAPYIPESACSATCCAAAATISAKGAAEPAERSELVEL